MLALRTSPPSFGVAEGERIARDLYGLAVSVSALPGERDCNFRLRTADPSGGDPSGAAPREFVLKIQDVAADSDSNDCLVTVLDHLAEQDPALAGAAAVPHAARRGRGRVSAATGSTTPPAS